MRMLKEKHVTHLKYDVYKMVLEIAMLVQKKSCITAIAIKFQYK